MGSLCGTDREPEERDSAVPELKPIYAQHTEPPKFCVFFDFDLTIAVKHVFSESGGASYPIFQEEFDTPDLLYFIGGEERLEQLKAHFQRLLDIGCHLFIVSHGHVRVNQYVCIKLDLLKYFSGVYRPGHKDECIEHILAQVQLAGNKALFIDDDENNVNACLRVCPSIHIFPRAGMTTQHLAKIEDMVQAGLNDDASTYIYQVEEDFSSKDVTNDETDVTTNEDTDAVSNQLQEPVSNEEAVSAMKVEENQTATPDEVEQKEEEIVEKEADEDVEKEAVEEVEKEVVEDVEKEMKEPEKEEVTGTTPEKASEAAADMVVESADVPP